MRTLLFLLTMVVVFVIVNSVMTTGPGSAPPQSSRGHTA